MIMPTVFQKFIIDQSVFGGKYAALNKYTDQYRRHINYINSLPRKLEKMDGANLNNKGEYNKNQDKCK